MRHFPIDTHCKNRSLWQRHVFRHDIAEWAIFTMGVYWEILCLLSDQTEISFLSTVKVQLDIRSNQKVITKKRLTNKYEMNSSSRDA